MIDEERAWSEGVRRCPVTLQPGCTPRQPEVRLLTEREPFSPRASAPLDLVLLTGAIAGRDDLPATSELLRGRAAIRVELIAADLEQLLTTLTTVG